MIKTLEDPYEKLGMKVGSDHTFCPAHGGSDSVSCKRENGGRIVWHCHNCGEGGTIIDAYMSIYNVDFQQAAQMLEEEYNMQAATTTTPNFEKFKPQHVAEVSVAHRSVRFDENFHINHKIPGEGFKRLYTNKATKYITPCLVDGELWAVIVFRWDTPWGKVIRQGHYDGHQWHMKGFPHRPVPLFAESEVLRHDKILFVEGEKCMIAANQAIQQAQELYGAMKGWYATTNVGGSSAIKKANLDILKGKDVYLFRDNDSPGKKMMEYVQEKIQGSQIFCLQGPEGFDIADWLEQGHDIRTIQDMAPESVNDDQDPIDAALEASHNVPPLEIESFFGELVKLEPNAIVLAMIFDNLKGTTGLPKGAIKAVWKSVVDEHNAQDWPLKVSYNVIDKVFEGNIIYANQIFWTFQDTHWRRCDNIGKFVKHEVERVVPTKAMDAERALKKSLTLLQHEVSVTGDALGFTQKPKSIINVQNGELHVDPITGEVELKGHNPANLLTYCLDVHYDPEATCPMFEQALLEVMNFDEDLKRHIEEVMGYMIQPRRELKNFFMFWGPRGYNGKSQIKKVIQALMGSRSTLSVEIKKFGNGNHDRASLVGKMLLVDDDVQKGIKLNDGLIKTISEEKEMTANPKNKDTFEFISYAVVLMLCNHLPHTSDLTKAMLHRANIIPFTNYFHPEDPKTDRHLFDRIIEQELPGILNLLLRGLQRLRRRQYWDYPEACVDAKNCWLTQTSNTHLFIEETFERDEGNRLYAKPLYQFYRTWCEEEGISDRYKLTKRNLKKKLTAMDRFTFESGDNNKGGWYIKNHRIKPHFFLHHEELH